MTTSPELLASLDELVDSTAPAEFRDDLASALAIIRRADQYAADLTVELKNAKRARDAYRLDSVDELVAQLSARKPIPNALAIAENRQHLDRRHDLAVEQLDAAQRAANRISATSIPPVFDAHADALVAWVGELRAATPFPADAPDVARTVWSRIGRQTFVALPPESLDEGTLDNPLRPLLVDLGPHSPTALANAERMQYAWDAIASGQYQLRSSSRRIVVPLADWHRRRPIVAPSPDRRPVESPRRAAVR